MFYYQSEGLAGRFVELGTRPWLHLNKHVINLVLLIYSLVILLTIYCHQQADSLLSFLLLFVSITPFFLSSCMYLFFSLTSNHDSTYLWRKVLMSVILLPLGVFMKRELDSAGGRMLNSETVSMWS
jgi:Mn2+/Fe2+ NRAMP family transporter